MFITYTHVDQIKSRAKKWQVNSYQNQRRRELKDRSAGSQRTRVLPWQQIPRRSGGARGVSDHGGVEGDDPHGAVIPFEAPLPTSPGSLRSDPFNSYPMQSSGRVQLTVDYFTQIYAPLNAGNYRDDQGGNWLLSYLFRVALQADLLFEATILFIWSQLPASQLTSSPEELERILISLRGSVMRKLHHRLTVPQLCCDDVTIHTILALMAGDFHRGQDDHVELHREGLRRVVELRGGMEKSHLQPQTRYSVTATEMMCDYAIRRRNRSPKTNITPDSTLTYPRHPFPPSLSKVLSALPEGFSDMALKTLLSNQVIRLLYRMTKTVEKSPAEFPEDTSIAVEMMRLSMESSASQLEKAIVTLSFAFRRFLSDVTAKGRPVNSSRRAYQSMEESLRALGQSIFGLFEKAGPDFIVWAVFLLASPGFDYGVPASTRDELLRKLQAKISAVRRFESFLAMLRKFLWHEKLVPCAKETWERMVERKR
ncbi:uncharacterized protein Z520_09743 [Fonsecaea multimorphosa CBS 102226]|uniref:Uncharacterized protein n=1 Tax=Fonsecaea multimorphosa CBS 102226 TaxID=1442371 RepID=A0A0D2JMY1_9EURO|nr:uncharacterized protein Z520_09743 [Fonsecaea multimorphosa CBS 102226]KIX94697.1 hypothetical protein Z520_09743 [Fonsecaea multimorphosa CBS 102226]OAL18799.1 hypothetical protein AYO22_10128 [Fonsecaea multimorphosa]